MLASIRLRLYAAAFLTASSAFFCSVMSMPISRISGDPSVSVNGKS